MSLFPAYDVVLPVDGNAGQSYLNSQQSSDTNEKGKENGDKDWIRNESFKINVSAVENEGLNSPLICRGEVKRKAEYEANESCGSGTSDSSETEHAKKYQKDYSRHGTQIKKSTKRERSRSRSLSKSRNIRHRSSSSSSRSRSSARSGRRYHSSSSKSRSRSPKYLKRKKSKRGKHKTKKRRQSLTTKLQKIPIFTPYKTFLEDFNIKSEDELQFALDR